jgi:hypothetical protein
MGNWIRGVLAVLVLIVMAAISGCAEEGSTSDQSEDTTTSAQGAEPEDTGRMSEGEFESFRSEAQRVVEETLQWSNGYETCATIGQTGDFAGFRDCIDEAWDGFSREPPSPPTKAPATRSTR